MYTHVSRKKTNYTLCYSLIDKTNIFLDVDFIMKQCVYLG